MKICILSGNPKTDGLCQGMVLAAKRGALEGGAEVDEIRLSDMKLMRCQVCGNGWGTCRDEDACVYGDQDDFNAIRARMEASDAVVMITPVYWGETAEALKAFLDRMRRCTFNHKDEAASRQALLIASAGGTGNGLLTCLEQMDRFCRHLGMPIYDIIGVNRWNSDYKREAIRAAVVALARGRKNGDTV
jgi:multimeric flavodoxin WrbA